MSKINIMRYIIIEDKVSGFCVYPPGATFGPRLTTEYEIVWIERGGGLWNYNGKDYKIGTDSVLLTKPGNKELFQWKADSHSSHYYIHFNLDIKNAPDIDELKQPDDWCFLQRLPENNILRPMLMHTYWLIKNGYTDKDPILQNALQQSILTFIRGVFDIEQGMPDDLPPSIDKIFKHISEKWSRLPIVSPTLEQLAAIACVSPTHLCRIFKATFNKAPMQTLLLIRLTKASTLLVQTNYQIREIAHLTGFESPYHFSRTFKTCYGISPAQYRLYSLQGKRLPLPHIIAKYLRHIKFEQ